MMRVVLENSKGEQIEMTGAMLLALACLLFVVMIFVALASPTVGKGLALLWVTVCG